MEQERFDRLARTVASSPSRRRVLTDLLAGLLAAVPALAGPRLVGAQNEQGRALGGAPCQEDDDCLTHRCLRSEVCSCATGPTPVACIDQSKNPCKESAQVCEHGVCERQDKPDGTPCPENDNPCKAGICKNGQCKHPDKPDGTACPATTDNPCYTHLCQNGQCKHLPHPDGAPCGEGGTCQSSRCECPLPTQLCEHEAKVCKLPVGQACERDAQCCDSMTCCRGQCRLKSGEVGCTTNDDCCTIPMYGGNACCNSMCCYACQQCPIRGCEGARVDVC